MEARFVDMKELNEFFEKKLLRDDLKNNSVMGICSIGDFLFLTEEFKKGKLIIDSLEKNYRRFIDGHEKPWLVYVAELEREQLSAALFDESIERKKLWGKAANKEISPRDSITMLALRPTENTWWPDSVFDEMCKSYGYEEE